ncbi:MAG: PfkB family carbohydrate kinase, partial [Nitrososphaerales archaeon]
MRKTPGRYEVSVLPDVFLDRIVTVGSIDSFFKSAKEKVSIGGGSMRGFKEQEIIGGNAANVAKALAALGVNVNLFVVGDGFAESILRWYFSYYPNAKVFVSKGRPGYTVALEFLEGDKHANVMVSDMGDVDDFDGSAFSEKDLELIARS